MKNPFNLKESGDLVIENGDFVIEDGDIKCHDIVNTNIDLYYFIANNNLSLAEKVQLDCKSKKPWHETFEPFWEQDINYHIQQYTIPVVIFSALSVEALINFYGVQRLSGNVFRKYEGKPAHEKLKLFHKAALKSRNLNIPLEVADSIKLLFKTRNSLVHYKTKLINSKNIDLKLISLETASKSFQIIKIISDFLSEKDTEFHFSFEENILNQSSNLNISELTKSFPVY